MQLGCWGGLLGFFPLIVQSTRRCLWLSFSTCTNKCCRIDCSLAPLKSIWIFLTALDYKCSFDRSLRATSSDLQWSLCAFFKVVFVFCPLFFKQSKCAQCCLETGWLNELRCNKQTDKMFPLPTMKIIPTWPVTLDPLSVLALLSLLLVFSFSFCCVKISQT